MIKVALALIVAECLLGYPLRQGMSITEIIYRAQHHPIESRQLPEALPATTRAALVRATDPAPARRFGSVLAFLDALELDAAGRIGWGEALLADSVPAAASPALATTTPARLAATEPTPATARAPARTVIENTAETPARTRKPGIWLIAAVLIEFYGSL